MALTQIPPVSQLNNAEFIRIIGSDNVVTGFIYDRQQRALFAQESQALMPALHGLTHVTTDPIPAATCDSPGLMAADDKCKLDAVVQTRLGVLGFLGAGFVGDGGWLQGDIILAAGTDFIHLERVGNVIRFVVDSAIPLNCAAESCLQLFWVQDESDVSAIRPPSCGGKLPGVNSYGELKVFLFPDSTIVNPANSLGALNNKGLYPSFVFQRYSNTISPNLGMAEMVLQRNPINQMQAIVGWTMTPGDGVAECVWYMGLDANGNLINYEFKPTSPGMLNEILCQGNLLTKQMAVIVDYTPQVFTSNLYSIQMWDVLNSAPVGPVITAVNVWNFQNPNGPTSGPSARALSLDFVVDLLPLGTLVDVWYFQVGQVSGSSINRYFFSKEPTLNANNLWNLVGGVDFGDIAQTMSQAEPGAGTGGHKVQATYALATSDFEDSVWGFVSHDDPLLLYGNATSSNVHGGTDGQYDLNRQHRAVVDPSLPGLYVPPSSGTEPFAQRPVTLWNRSTITQNCFIRAEIGQPTVNGFPPYDILFGTQVQSYRSQYLCVDAISAYGELTGSVVTSGASWNDLPRSGTLRVLWPAARRGLTWDYNEKFIAPLIGSKTDVCLADAYNGVQYPGAVGDVCELLHGEFGGNCVRLQFNSHQDGSVGLQFKVGVLGLENPYELAPQNRDTEDFVRGLRAGYTVSSVYQQAGVWDGVQTQPQVNVPGFGVFMGGLTGNPANESWNILEIMVRFNQVWIWWNSLLVPPNPILSGALPYPMAVNTPYFPITQPLGYGKVAFKLWPGALARRFEVRAQPRQFSEYTYGQLAVS